MQDNSDFFILNDDSDLIKVEKKISKKLFNELFLNNVKVAANDKLPEEVRNKAKENMQKLQSGLFPQHDLQEHIPLIGHSLPHRKTKILTPEEEVDEKWKQFNKPKKLAEPAAQPGFKAKSKDGKEVLQYTGDEGRPIAADIKEQTDLRDTLSEKSAAKPKADKISLKQDLSGNATVVQRRQIMAAANREAKKDKDIKLDPQVKRRANLAIENIKSSDIELDNNGIPKWHPIFKQYGHQEENWSKMDESNKFAVMHQHYALNNVLPEKRITGQFPMPSSFPIYLKETTRPEEGFHDKSHKELQKLWESYPPRIKDIYNKEIMGHFRNKVAKSLSNISSLLSHIKTSL